MAEPTINWNAWSASTIAPIMKAVIHLESGDIEVTDNDISYVSYTLRSFDSQYIMFGPPVPGTASLEIIDYKQRFNPVTNHELIAGVQIDMFLGLRSTDILEKLGDNLIASVGMPQWVTWQGRRFYAVPATTTIILPTDTEYVLTFDTELADGSTEHVRRTVNNSISSDYTIQIALINTDIVAVKNLELRQRLDIWQPYGTWYAQEWSFDSSGSTCTVDMVDGLNDLLTLDNRADAQLPSVDVSLKQFLLELVSLQLPNVMSTINASTRLKYSFYEGTQAKTINNCVVALMAWLFMMPDGEVALSSPHGNYTPNITLTDDDVIAYTIQQTSAITADSAIVHAMLPTSVEASEILSQNELALTRGTSIPLNVDGVQSVDYIVTTGLDTTGIIDLFYDWDPASMRISTYSNMSVIPEKTSTYGRCIECSDVPISEVAGTLPYVLSDNKYIQTINHAQAMSRILSDFINLPYNTLQVEIRGGYGIWLGAKIQLVSDRYAVKANYTVIGMSFTYDGSIATILTLQRY